MTKPKSIATALFGGSFSPPHGGHLRLAEYVVIEGFADELWFMVSPRNPLKEASRLWPLDLRLKLTGILARLAMRETGRKAFHASDFECALPQPSYTVHTLEALTRVYPNREFLLLVGADNWNSFDRWRRHDDILARHRLLIYPRPGAEMDTEAPPPHVTFLTEAPLLPVSSTEVRRLWAGGGDLSPFLPQEILAALPRHEALPTSE